MFNSKSRKSVLLLYTYTVHLGGLNIVVLDCQCPVLKKSCEITVLERYNISFNLSILKDITVKIGNFFLCVLFFFVVFYKYNTVPLCGFRYESFNLIMIILISVLLVL